MLKEVANGEFITTSGGCLNFWETYYYFQAGKVRLPRREGAWKEEVYKQMMRSQSIEPVKLGDHNHRAYWVFQNKFYWDNDDLTKVEIKALALEREHKKKRRIQLAIARMDKLQNQTDAMESHSQSLPREPIPDDVKIFVWQRDKGRCVKCGSNEYLEYDHIIPLSMGGSNTSRNLQLLCEKCNREKGGDLA